MDTNPITPITQTQYEILIENNKKAMKQMDEMKVQIDDDRKDLNGVRNDVAGIVSRLDTIDGNFNRLDRDIKEIKLLLSKLPGVATKAIETKLETISLQNPKKAFMVHLTVLQSIKLYIKKLLKRK